MRALAVALALAAGPVAGQSGLDGEGGLRIEPLPAPEPAPQAARVTDGAGAVLRGLDKVSGEITEMEMTVGDTRRLGRIEVTLGACRYPPDNPSGEAFAWLEVISDGRDEPDFRGWMIASSPALNALDHARYDVWVIRCTSV